jgi:hypothetical protein
MGLRWLGARALRVMLHCVNAETRRGFFPPPTSVADVPAEPPRLPSGRAVERMFGRMKEWRRARGPWRLRSLIERIVLTPDENAPNGLAIELFCDLATILNLTAATEPTPAKAAGGQINKSPRDAGVLGSTLSVVAGHETDDDT